MEICSIILSAGKGSRMFSDIPKPLHLISGKTMLEWVIDANKLANIKKNIIVIPKEAKPFAGISSDFETVVQKIPKGTGDAVKKASVLLEKFTGIILVCFGDTPFLTSQTLKKIIKSFNSETKLVITGFKKNEKNNYGKIIFSMDKKAFKGWQRQAIRDHLATLQAPLLTSKNIRALLESE